MNEDSLKDFYDYIMEMHELGHVNANEKESFLRQFNNFRETCFMQDEDDLTRF